MKTSPGNSARPADTARHGLPPPGPVPGIGPSVTHRCVHAPHGAGGQPLHHPLPCPCSSPCWGLAPLSPTVTSLLLTVLGIGPSVTHRRVHTPCHTGDQPLHSRTAVSMLPTTLGIGPSVTHHHTPAPCHARDRPLRPPPLCPHSPPCWGSAPPSPTTVSSLPTMLGIGPSITYHHVPAPHRTGDRPHQGSSPPSPTAVSLLLAVLGISSSVTHHRIPAPHCAGGMAVGHPNIIPSP